MKSRARLSRRGPALVLAGGVLLAAYAAAVEPFWIDLTRHEVEAPVLSPLTVAHLTDLHTHGLGRRERAVVALLERERPDLVVVTGDSVVNGDLVAPPLGLADDPSYRAAGEVLARLRAPLGVWAVRGNWENLRRVRDERAFYAAAGVRLLVNESARVRDDLWLVGLDDADAGVLRRAAPLAAAGAGRPHARRPGSPAGPAAGVAALGQRALRGRLVRPGRGTPLREPGRRDLDAPRPPRVPPRGGPPHPRPAVGPVSRRSAATRRYRSAPGKADCAIL